MFKRLLTLYCLQMSFMSCNEYKRQIEQDNTVRCGISLKELLNQRMHITKKKKNKKSIL